MGRTVAGRQLSASLSIGVGATTSALCLTSPSCFRPRAFLPLHLVVLGVLYSLTLPMEVSLPYGWLPPGQCHGVPAR